MNVNWHGVLTTGTPQFHPDQSLNLPATRNHLDTHPKLVQYIELAVQECGLGSELTRAPRLPIIGEERDEVLKIFRDGVAIWPVPSNA